MSIRTWKFKFHHSSFLKQLFDPWFHDYRYAYNKSHWISKECASCFYSDIDLINLILPSYTNSRIPWHLKTPQNIRQNAIFEYSKNVKAAWTNLKNKNIKNFNMGYLKKKKTKYKYCFGFPGSDIKVIDRRHIKIFPRFTNNYIFKLSKKIPLSCVSENNTLLKEHKIYFNGSNFYLLISLERKKIDLPKRRQCIAIDPGVRKFAVAWEPKNCYTFGHRKYIQIKHLLLKRDHYQSQKKWKNYHKIENRIKNLISQLHHQMSTFLCQRYSNIILPELDVRSLIQKNTSKEYRKSILRLSICQFRELLKTKGELYKTNIIIKDVNERYSSRMCSSCRFINKKSSLENKKCSKCELEIDRDLNGAKNIYYMNKYLIN